MPVAVLASADLMPVPVALAAPAPLAELAFAELTADPIADVEPVPLAEPTAPSDRIVASLYFSVPLSLTM